MWLVMIITKRGRRLARFNCDTLDGARALFVDLKMTGAFAPPAHFLVIHDSGNHCLESYTITDFIN